MSLTEREDPDGFLRRRIAILEAENKALVNGGADWARYAKHLEAFLKDLPCPDCSNREHDQFHRGSVKKEDYSCCYRECETCGYARNALAAFKRRGLSS